ncbi:MAG: heme A synthase [Acidimicrobiales bacterium]|nr:heme A synthase [Acidimicrobiales bacterium]
MQPPRLSPAAYRRITFVAFLALAFIVVSGAAVRLTGSGLGCPDWPTCYETQFHAKAEYHAMIEFVNRLVTGLVSVAVILAVLGSLVRTPRRRDLTWWSLGLVAGVVAQILIGAFVVFWHLTPPIVIAHFLVSIVLLWNALVLYRKAGQPQGPAHLLVSRDLLVAIRVLFANACLVVITGTIVTGAGPHGGDESVDRLPYFLPDVARVHGASVMLLVLLTVALLLLLRRAEAPRVVRRSTVWLLGALVLNAAIGYTQYFTGVPAALVAFHVAGAVLVWSTAVWLNLVVVERTPRPAEVPAETALAAR